MKDSLIISLLVDQLFVIVILTSLHVSLLVIPKLNLYRSIDRDDYFVGREDVLSKIKDRLQTNFRVSLSGWGGMGYVLL